MPYRQTASYSARAGGVAQIISYSAVPSRGIVERHCGRQQCLDMLHPAGFRHCRPWVVVLDPL